MLAPLATGAATPLVRFRCVNVPFPWARFLFGHCVLRYYWYRCLSPLPPIVGRLRHLQENVGKGVRPRGGAKERGHDWLIWEFWCFSVLSGSTGMGSCLRLLLSAFSRFLLDLPPFPHRLEGLVVAARPRGKPR